MQIDAMIGPVSSRVALLSRTGKSVRIIKAQAIVTRAPGIGPADAYSQGIGSEPEKAASGQKERK